ncbi:MAG: ATP-binding protein [Desulfobacterales bacterium]|jgi:two-component system sensor histidine kinase PilS (NtrC family)|nr:ATP-binding protein [Desulfobacterales bacterium]
MTNDFRSELYDKLKWLTFFRLLVTAVLLGGVAYIHAEYASSFLTPLLLAVYVLSSGVFVLTIVYSLLLKRITRYSAFATVQIILDTFIVSLMIYLTGGFSSGLSFLYLVVMIYSSMLIYRKGSLIMAALCTIQYGIMVDLEYYGILTPLISYGAPPGMSEQWRYVIFKILMIAVGCFAVSFLSSLLSEQLRKSRRELLAMEAHVKRVEKMATVGEMAAGLAHEIKNPLASLSGSIQLIREDIPFNEDHDRLMNIVLREADRLNTLLSNFLLFARPQARKLELIELNKALAETVSLFEKSLGASGRIAIKREFSAGIWIEMDPTHLHQVMWNLLLNAADAIDGRGQITVTSHKAVGRGAQIKVADTGCGIPENKVKLIFDPFYTTKSTGTGLGLSIVHRILETYGFRVNVESEPGSGTIFSIDVRQSQAPA